MYCDMVVLVFLFSFGIVYSKHNTVRAWLFLVLLRGMYVSIGKKPEYTPSSFVPLPRQE